MGKRIFDIIVSLALIILLTPVFIIISLIIRFSSLRGVIYGQERIKKNFEPFTCYKFQTMAAEDDSTKNDGITSNEKMERITNLGNFLRKYRLDELPQLFNVLKGDMSMVGPRPQIAKYTKIYPEKYKKILSVKPGMTGFSTIFFYDREEKMLADAEDGEKEYIENILPKKFRYNLFYIDKGNFIFDLMILWWTAKKLMGFPIR